MGVQCIDAELHTMRLGVEGPTVETGITSPATPAADVRISVHRSARRHIVSVILKASIAQVEKRIASIGRELMKRLQLEE